MQQSSASLMASHLLNKAQGNARDVLEIWGQSQHIIIFRKGVHVSQPHILVRRVVLRFSLGPCMSGGRGNPPRRSLLRGEATA